MASMSSEGCDPNLTPLLDLVLQLIMFFMITVNFIRVDQFDDSIHLPVATNAVPIENTAEEYVFLNLNPKGELVGSLAGSQLDTPGKLQAYLQSQRKDLERGGAAKGHTGPVKVVVILRADKDVRYSRMWEVLDSCKRAGFIHWQLRVMTRA
jgi:biopolymer transport protein ExbD